MNTDKVQQEVNKIILDVRTRGWRLSYKQTKKSLAELEALGLTQFITRGDMYQEIVNAVIEAAKDAGGKKISWSTLVEDGDAGNYLSKPSALYLALNEVETEPEAEEETADDNDEQIDGDELVEALRVYNQAEELMSAQRNGGRMHQFDSIDDALIAIGAGGGNDEIAHVRKLYPLGKEYSGRYILKSTMPRTAALPYDIPANAVAYWISPVLWNDDFHAVDYMLYVLRRDDADREMTPSEIAKEYGIEAGTVRRSVRMGYISARKSGKAVLIKRADAEARWGNKDNGTDSH